VRIHIGSTEIQRFALKVGDAIVEHEPADAGSAARQLAANESADGGGAIVGPPEMPSPPKTPSEDQEARAARPENARADITLAAGESATVHDGHPPAAVRLRTNEVCPGEAIVELGGHGHHRERIAGSRSVVVRLKPGTEPYRVRCAADGVRAKPRASGVLSLRRDTGDVPLARHAPVDVLDADGRRYTVLFQTRLPQLTLAWPRAAGATGLELHLESPAGTRVLPLASPSRPLPPGTLQEGTYTWWYTAGDGRQSPKTTISIRFDNTAPTAQFFRARPDAGDGPPGAIAVDGVTVEGAKVSVGGKPLALDGRGRFRANVAPQAGDDAVAVRLEHPRTGVHYYVRRRSDVH
jgi:hypothetical protein